MLIAWHWRPGKHCVNTEFGGAEKANPIHQMNMCSNCSGGVCMLLLKTYKPKCVGAFLFRKEMLPSFSSRQDMEGCFVSERLPGASSTPLQAGSHVGLSYPSQKPPRPQCPCACDHYGEWHSLMGLCWCEAARGQPCPDWCTLSEESIHVSSKLPAGKGRPVENPGRHS